MILRQRERETKRDKEREGWKVREGRGGGECKSMERCWCVFGAEAINWHNNHSAARA